MNEENYGKRNPFMDDPAPGYEQPASRIDWEIEIAKAEQWSNKRECCAKFIDLAKQIAAELDATKLDVDYYREKAIDYLERSAGLTRSYARDCVGNRFRGDWDDQSKKQ